MREIKYRVWDKENKQMWYGGFYIQGDTGDVWLDSEDGLIELNQDTLVLMQSTGLHNKDGKEIWEGDIVEDSSSGDISAIEYDKTKATFIQASCCGDNEIWRDARYCKVIGNIHENPKLLETK